MSFPAHRISPIALTPFHHIKTCDQNLLTSNPPREKIKVGLGQFRGASATQTSIEAAPNPFSEAFCELSRYS